MDIVLDYPSPLKEGVVGAFAEDIGLTKKPPQKNFRGQLFSQVSNCGNIRVAVTEKRNRIAISTHYMNAHLRSFQLLIIAKIAAGLGEKPKLTFSQEFAHMDLSHWFPEGIRERNTIHFEGA
jgi:hypothetical protein